jgi:hypothetical protein
VFFLFVIVLPGYLPTYLLLVFKPTFRRLIDSLAQLLPSLGGNHQESDRNQRHPLLEDLARERKRPT